MNVPILSDVVAQGKTIELLFWVGCAGSYDARAQRVTRALARILNHVGINYAVLGDEELCTGDPARRAGNEFVFQMTALQNVQTLNDYGIQKIVTACPHCFNTLKNEYPALGGSYEVVHHTQLIQELIDSGRLRVEGGVFKGKRITYHDSCYLGRVNGVYEAPRNVLKALDVELVEMKRCKSNGLCCGAGGAQMFKEDEPGRKRINTERVEEALNTHTKTIAANCPFCLTMLRDGVSERSEEQNVAVYDLAEMIAGSLDDSAS